MKTIKTVREFIDYFGGLQPLGGLLNQDPRLIAMWQTKDWFPAHMYLAVNKLASVHGAKVSGRLFPMTRLADPSRRRNAHGQFVSKKKPESTEAWMEALARGIEASLADRPEPHCWRDSDGNVVSPEMQCELTEEAIMNR
jgi:hypothetical protein